MRINRYVAFASGVSRRAADKAVTEGRVKIDGETAQTGQDIKDSQKVTLDGQLLTLPSSTTTIILNKPVGYVVSRNGQGAPTIYSVLPAKYHQLKPIGRLDKDSSGLLLMSNDGQLIQSLAHPSFNKQKIYQVSLDKALEPEHQQQIQNGVKLEDGPSYLKIIELSGKDLTLSMEEGRNRQIRRTFSALGYKVKTLHRTNFGVYSLNILGPREYQEVKN